MKTRDELLQLLTENHWKDLPDFIKINSKGPPKTRSNLEEALVELNNSQQDLVWKKILTFFVKNYLGTFFEKNSTERNLEVFPASEEEYLKIFEAILKMCILEVKCLVDEKKAVLSVPQHMVQFVVLIGKLIREFNNDVLELSVEICEEWVKNKFQQFLEILPNVLLVLIEMCLKPSGKKKDVDRVWHLREGLPSLIELINLNTEDSKYIKDTLVSCSSSSLFLSSENGVKFLSLVFASPCVVSLFHNAIKNRLPYCTKSQSEAYAQIYFRTWKSCQGETRVAIEQNCLQDLMYLAVHADPSAKQLSPNLNAFLRTIHKQKKHLQTASMMYSLYEPFIWRSLKVANGYVRRNAVTLLCDLFPCTDVSLTNEEKDELMEKQYQAFLNLLLDPCHFVRIVTVKGVFSVLNDFWLIIPSHIIQKMFQIFLKKLICDASCAEVRMQVIQGITKLLDCPDSGPFITNILPHISSSFDDINASVRISFLKLLLKVKATRFIKYWKLVPMEHLLNRLADDVKTVRSLITKLIYSSFLSAHLDESETLQRCITLIEMNRNGARRFYQHAATSVDLDASVRFILFIWRTLFQYVQLSNAQGNLSTTSLDENGSPNTAGTLSQSRGSKKRKKTTAQREENKENQAEVDNDEMPLHNPVIVGGLLDVIVILWTMKAPNLRSPENFKYLEELRNRISRTFPAMWSFFKENEDISKTLLYLSSFLPKSHVSTMVGLCLSRLRSMDENDEVNDRFATYVNALCNWNRLDDIVGLISEWITAALSSQENSKSKDQKATTRVRFEEKIKPKPLGALQILSHILEHPLNKLCLLQSHREFCVKLCEEMSLVKDRIEERCKKLSSRLSPFCSDHFLLRCWADYLCIVALLNYKPPVEATKQASERRLRNSSPKDSSLLEKEAFDSLLLFKNILEEMKRLSEEESSSFDVDFFHSCALVFIKGSSDLIAVGIADEDFLRSYLQFITEFIKKAPFSLNTCLSSFQGILNAHQHLYVYSKEKDHLLPETSITFLAFVNVLSVISLHMERSATFEKEVLLSLSEGISSAVQVLIQSSNAILDSIMKHFVEFSLNSLHKQVSLNLETVSEVGRIKDFNGEAFVLLNSVHKKSKLSQAFVKHLKIMIENLNNENPHLLLAAVVLVSVLLNDGGALPRHNLNEVVLSMNDFFQNLALPGNEENDNESTLDHKNIRCFRRARELWNSLEIN
ncbi:UNVERIFIED_CONTAM: hypothetical protein RMT77_009801 [Armadillidium vulgare]